MGEGLFELAVDAEPFEGGGEVAGGPGGPELAGRAEFNGGLLGDEQVGVGRIRPAAAAVFEPAQDSTAGEVVVRTDVAADGDAPVAQADVVPAASCGSSSAVPRGRRPGRRRAGCLGWWPWRWLRRCPLGRVCGGRRRSAGGHGCGSWGCGRSGRSSSRAGTVTAVRRSGFRDVCQ